MEKSTHRQNLTGNRHYAPVDSDWEAAYASIIAHQALKKGWDAIDIDSVEQAHPGVIQQARSIYEAKQGQKHQAELEKMCGKRERARYAELVA